LRNFIAKPAKMLKRQNKEPQLEMFQTVLATFVNPSHELCLLGKQIDWDSLETDFAPLYGKTGRPSVPIRTMVGLLLLKQMYNLGDETVMERWVENPYWQYFCGEVYFQYKVPFDPSDFVHFRKRIGEEGMQTIFKQSIIIFGEEKLKNAVKEVRVDTTVQEKNITFPTDRKLYTRVLEHCRKIAKEEGVQFKRTYTRKIKHMQYQLRFVRKPKNLKKQKRLLEQYRRLVIKLCDELVNKLTEQQYGKHMERLDIMFRILTQERSDKDKVYSVHEPNTQCIAKGKDHKAYEFGNKSSFAYTRKEGIIVGALAFDNNPYDGHTLEPQLEQIRELTGFTPKVAIVDRGYKGKEIIGFTQVVLPKNLKRESYYKKQQRKARQRSRAGIEALISHLKLDHRMLRNYLSGNMGNKINTLLAAAAYNMKKWMRWKRKEQIFRILYLFISTPYQSYALIHLSERCKNRGC